ncbi:MAG: hypothetical protein HYU66_13395 [Armatimonadetes bacterium]|nr:hypothetical protein [Armatimonadota bacterium]
MADERDEQLRRVLDEAFRAFEQGDDERARRLCRDSLALDANSSTAHSLMGLLYEREGRPGEAASEFVRVVSANPESEAERTTLDRLRGAEPRERRGFAASGNVWIYLAAGAVAMLVFMFVLVGLTRLLARHPDEVREASARSASVEEDLLLASQAFNRGDYDTALAASRRVLIADPSNATAEEIRDRSLAYLRAAREQPAAPRPAGPAAPALASAPANPPSGPATMPSTAPTGPSIHSTPAYTPPSLPPVTAPGYASGLPPVTPNLSPGLGYTPPSVVPGRAKPQIWPPLVTTQLANGIYSHWPPAPTLPVRPTARRPGGELLRGGTGLEPLPAPDENPAAEDGTGVGEPQSHIHIEVHDPEPRHGDTSPREVTPDTGATDKAAPPVDPEARRRQEEQRQLREQRERQKNAAKRRAEREQR